jgi:LmbE family N-acetylglucosaminyl deacetylase
MPKTILAIGAHMDDAEIGAGGVLIQAARQGHRVVVVTVVSDYSTWQATLGREEQVKRDLIACGKAVGIEKRFLDFPYHVIDGGDLDLKQKLARIYVELNPEIAFIHHHEDHWPDHVACAKASHDAFLFSHGLSGNLDVRRCPLIYSYTVSPIQTYRFEPDVYFDVGDVMEEYMALLARTDSCLSGRPVEEMLKYEFKINGPPTRTLRLSEHGLSKFSDCLQHGNRAECMFANGFRLVWGPSRREKI